MIQNEPGRRLFGIIIVRTYLLDHVKQSSILKVITSLTEKLMRSGHTRGALDMEFGQNTTQMVNSSIKGIGKKGKFMERIRAMMKMEN